MVPIARVWLTPVNSGAIVWAAIGNTIIFFAEIESRTILSEVITVTAATIAVLLATAITFRQGKSAPHGKRLSLISDRPALLACGRRIWAACGLYYHVAPPIPSYSDYLWLAGYPFFAYNLFTRIAIYR